MKSISIGILGVMPPPIGGVSIHIKRFEKILENNNFNYKIYDFFSNKNKRIIYNNAFNIILIKNKKIWLIKQMFNCSYNLMHIHNLNWKLIYMYTLIKKYHCIKLIITLHSFRDNVNNYNRLKKYFFNKALKKVDKFIAVGENEKNKLILYGCKKEKIKVIPAYINPMRNLNDYNDIPNNVNEFLNSNNNFIICSNGCVKFYNNEDLYGLDLLIELIKNLKIKNYKVKLIFALLGNKFQNNNEQQYYYKLKKRIENYRLQNNILIYEVQNTEFYPILESSDLFIRPTNTDGDAISIRESIYFNVPVIASNVVERPKGTIIFKNRNLEDLYNKVVCVIKNYDKYKKEVEKIEVKDNSEKILKVYEEVLNN